MPRSRRAVLLVALGCLCATSAAPAAGAGVPARAAGQGSPFAWRGVVEGAYGRAWTTPQRVRMLDWLGANGFNAYVHAPKSDPYAGAAWRTPYPPASQQEFADEISRAQADGVQWIPNLSPARPAPGDPARICFSCPGDLSAAVAKFTPFLQAGAQVVMVSFDDVDERLSAPEDIAAYGGSGPGPFGRANADFLNHLLDGLRAVSPAVQVLTVPADYAGTADTAYLQGLRSTPLRPEVQVLWTGPLVRSSNFTRADAATYAGLSGHEPIVWENWLNADFTPSRVFLGPYQRSNDLAGAVGGFFFNPMNAADLNRLPLATAGAWLRDPAHYVARRAWMRAIAALAGPSPVLADELRAWAETSSSTTLYPQEAPTFSGRAQAFLDAYRQGRDWSGPEAALDNELGLVQRAARDLAKLPDRSFAPQASRFLAAAARAAAAARIGVLLLVAERPGVESWPTRAGAIAGTVVPGATGDALRAQLQSQMAAMTPSPWVYGCRGAGLGCPPGGYNVMDAFLSGVLALDAAWTAHASAVATPVRLLVNGTPVPVTAGSFTLRAKNCGRPLVAIDAAGGRTVSRAPACARVRRARQR